MKCPHCLVAIHPDFRITRLNVGGDGTWLPIGMDGLSSTYWSVRYMVCPSCKQAILFLDSHLNMLGSACRDKFLAYPRGASRTKAHPDVPTHLAEDFNEACLVLIDSPKASAALSRRCLQALLHDQGFTQRDLVKAIDAILASNQLPSAIAESLDAVRNIGNFAAHPQKDTKTGSILPVEPEEAEWNLEVLEALFEHFYVLPAKNQARIDALNVKLAAAGKPPMK